MESNKDAEPLYYLAMAYHKIATGDFFDALHYFELLPPEKILEDELQQIAGVAYKLEDYDLAKACLAKLTEFANLYVPQYAKLLKLLGQEEEAIHCYTEFLENNPEDVFIWNNLGILYFDIGASEAAKIAFEMTLSKDIQNQQAKDYLEKIAAA